MMKAEMKLEVAFKDAEAAEAALRAMEQKDTGRAKVSLSVSGSMLKITITASDITAMRASANSSMRALQAIEGVENIHEGV